MQHTTESTKAMRALSRLAPLLAVLVLVATFAGSARADGRFVYETCDWELPAGNPPAISLVEEPGVASYEAFQTCVLPDGSIGIKQSAPVNGSLYNSVRTAIPSTPGGWVESLTVTASAGQFHNGNGGGIYRLGRQEAGTASWPVAGAGDSPRFFLLRNASPTALETPVETENAFGFVLTCPLFTTCEPGAFVAAHFLAATEVDPTPPVIGAVEGSLVSGNVLRGHQGIRAGATDVGSGMRSLELKVNGFAMPGTANGACAIASVENPSYKGVVAITPSPCQASLSDVWDVDTSAPPFQNGANTIQVCASDFATIGSPNVTCSSPQTVQVDNACTDSKVAGGTNLSAGFASNHSDAVTVGFGNPAQITGRLTDQGGTPVSGATICMQSQPAGSSTPATQTTQTATTDSDGFYSIEVKPGANRHLLVGYRHDSFQVAKTLSVATRAHPTIRLATHKIRGGHRVRITGSLPSPDPGEHVLALQGSGEHGHVWLTFKKVITDPEGNYGTSYRFTKPRRTTGFRVRVVAPAQAGYEYASGTSKAARIRVRP